MQLNSILVNLNTRGKQLNTILVTLNTRGKQILS